MKPRYEYGTEVRLTRNVRNDGTYPGEEVGTLLVRRGEVGAIYDVGSYLQDQIIYRVFFLEAGKTVGCREEELIRADDPWVPNKFEFREKVYAARTLAMGGEVIAEQGDIGEIEKIVKDETSVSYHVRFHGRVFLMPEAVLTEEPPAEENAESSAH
ncbi:nitrogen fixation protein NifZ [Halioxenophilus sp. WMMB6]|uniref:nitrogen fixation protein NifZ n=1 Tax=Halioxenophilus sp. WMMB6 TaxID=3073815 RepID=UPI00295EB215|nr:nitrogen fixation protein NifZ [Halioxenophilus sp. WMMB6]